MQAHFYLHHTRRRSYTHTNVTLLSVEEAVEIVYKDCLTGHNGGRGAHLVKRKKEHEWVSEWVSHLVVSGYRHRFATCSTKKKEMMKACCTSISRVSNNSIVSVFHLTSAPVFSLCKCNWVNFVCKLNNAIAFKQVQRGEIGKWMVESIAWTVLFSPGNCNDSAILNNEPVHLCANVYLRVFEHRLRLFFFSLPLSLSVSLLVERLVFFRV